MIKSLKPLAVLSLLLSTINCSHMTTSDWQGSVTLPASGDCYSFNVMSGKETRLPADSAECKYKKAHSVWIDSESYKMLRADIQKNCQYQQCKQITGAFDGLFLAIDEALRSIPGGLVGGHP